MEAIMSVRGQFRKLLTRMVFGRNNSGWLFHPGSRRRYDAKTNLLASNVVMAPVLWIARNFIEAKLSIIDDGEVTRDHEMIELIRRPNAYYSGVLLWMATLISYLLDGNAYWIIVRNNQRRPVELWYAPHWLIEPVSHSETEFIQYYRYRPGGEQIDLDLDDVVHFRFGLDPDNPRKGMSQLKPAMREVFTDEEAGNFAASVLTNGGVPGLIISPKGDVGGIPQQEVDATKQYVSDQFSGDGRGAPLVLSGQTEVQEFGWDPQKVNLSAIRNIPEERVTALLGVPAAIVGFGTGLEQATQNATMSTMRRIAYENAIIPVQRLMSEELQVQLLGEFEPNPDAVEVEFDRSEVAVLQEDQNELVSRLDKMVNGGWLTVADAQAQAGYDPDETQRVYLRKAMQVTVPAGSQATQTRARKARKGEPDDGRSRLVTLLMQSSQQQADAFADGLVKRFEEYAERAMQLWSEQIDNLTTAGASEPVGTKSLEDTVSATEVMQKLGEEYPKEQVLRYEPFFVSVATTTVNNMNTAMELGINLTDPMERAVIEAAGKRMGLVDLSEQTKSAMFRAIAEGREAGEAGEQLAQRIQSEVSRGPWRSAQVRSEVISRTEAKYAQNIASKEAAKESGALAMEVVDAQIGNSDDYCRWINGQVVSVSEAEALSSSEHPNGTRSFIPVYDEERAAQVIDAPPER